MTQQQNFKRTTSAAGEPCLLAIDNGTQSVRALLFDLAGNLLAKSQVQIEAYFAEQPGWAEQHPEYYWASLCQACQQLWADSGIDKGRVLGVSVTTQRNTMINLDANGKALRPAMVWLDQRRADQYPKVNSLWRAAFKAIRMTDTLKYFQTQAEINWIKQHQPEIWDKTDKYVFLSGFFIQRLCGRFVDSVAGQVGYVPFDYKKQRWANQLDFKWQALAVKPEMLGELAQPGEVIGEITPAAAEQTGIPVGLPLVAAASDKACEVLGAGCLTPDIGCLSYGTAATMNTTNKKYVEVERFIPPYPAAVPGQYSTEVQIYRGFWMVSWFKQQFGHKEQNLAKKLDITAEELFDKLVEDVPPGSMGLTLQPYWSPGVRDPGPEAKGSIIGFGDVHTRAHVYRSILEGLAYALRDGMERTEKRSGTKIERLRVAGGGSQSDIAMQLTADIFNRPAERPHTFETSGLGAAIDAAVGLGLHNDFDTAVEAMTRAGRCFEPQPEAQRVYDQLYKRVYQKMYKQLQPLYEDIKEITGYPA